MLESPRKEITEFPLPQQLNELVRRCEHPRSKHSGIIRFLVGPGDQVKKEQPVASITDIFGRPLGDGYIRSKYEGYMIALQSKMTVYPNDVISEMGIKNDEPLVVQIPSGKE